MNRKVLWVDDMLNWTGIFISNLKIIASKADVNLSFVERQNGENIDQVLEFFDFDIILMDYNMQPFRGDHYIRQIREHQHLDGTPILFYSENKNVDLTTKVADLKNVHVVTRGTLTDELKKRLFPKKG